MAYLYLTESDLKLGCTDGQVVIKRLGGEKIREVPFHAVDGIAVYGMAQLSTQLIRKCIAECVPITYYSLDGHYFGGISSQETINPIRQKRQIYLTDDPSFCLQWTKQIVSAKIENSITLLMSLPEIHTFEEQELHGLLHSLENLEAADSVDMVLGFEGNAARTYFACLPKLLKNDEFAFEGRSTRPPRDPVNSMLSYGYSLFYRNIIGAIERHGLHPYFAYMHKIKLGHAALSSDLIEEYRAPLVDKTVIDFVNDGEVEIGDFNRSDAGALYMNRETSKRLTARFSDIIAKNQQYFLDSGSQKSFGFQAMLDMKIEQLIKAIDRGDAGLYVPYVWKASS